MSPRLPAALLLALAACGDNVDPVGPTDASEPDAQVPDAQVPDAREPDAAVPRTIVITVPGVEYLVYRDGDGPWTEPVALGDGDYEIVVTDAYQYLAACDADAPSRVGLVGATVLDEGAFAPFFCPNAALAGPVPGGPYHVTTTMQQPGSAIFTSHQSSTTGPWSVAFTAPAGVRHLIAHDADRMLIRRDVAITGDTVLPAIDLDVEGTVMDGLPVTVTNLGAGETFLAYGVATVGAMTFDVRGSGAVAPLPPSTLLTPSEVAARQFKVNTQGGPYLRAALLPVDGDTATVTLIAPPVGLAFDEVDGALVATWSQLPSADRLWFGVVSYEPDPVVLSAYLSGRFVEVTGATQLGSIELPAGFDPSWLPDLDAPYLWTFSLTDNDDEATHYLEVRGQENFAL